jgi:hypothetical protein
VAIYTYLLSTRRHQLEEGLVLDRKQLGRVQGRQPRDALLDKARTLREVAALVVEEECAHGHNVVA